MKLREEPWENRFNLVFIPTVFSVVIIGFWIAALTAGRPQDTWQWVNLVGMTIGVGAWLINAVSERFER